MYAHTYKIYTFSYISVSTPTQNDFHRKTVFNINIYDSKPEWIVWLLIVLSSLLFCQQSTVEDVST